MVSLKEDLRVLLVGFSFFLILVNIHIPSRLSLIITLLWILYKVSMKLTVFVFCLFSCYMMV